MSTPDLVRRFYERIWNAGELDAIPELLDEQLVFRGSLSVELQGHVAFREYVMSVRRSLAEYRCEILDCVAEGDRAFARMRFAGRHVEEFRGFAPTGMPVSWQGAALFRFEAQRIAELWVLGDLHALERNLQQNAAAGT